MNITLWGVRGSIPTFNPGTQLYGGNTSCVEVEADGTLLILDAGSGIQHVNFSDNIHYDRIDILLTHLHIDHIQGLGFFKPLFNPAKEVHIWGPVSNTQSLRERLGFYFSPPLSPVYFRDLTCQLFIHEIENSTFQIGPFTIESRYVIHPGPTVGFRVQHKRGAFAFIPDHEPALGRNGILKDKKWLSGNELASGVDILMHDAQYTAEEYKTRVGWGHSTMDDALHFADVLQVKRLLLTHHDPSHTDAQLETMYARLKETNSYSFPYELAVEGKRIDM